MRGRYKPVPHQGGQGATPTAGAQSVRFEEMTISERAAERVWFTRAMRIFCIFFVCLAAVSCTLSGGKKKKTPKLTKRTIISASCLPGANRKSTKQRTTLIGVSKSDLLLCAGTPDAIFKSGGSEFLTYTQKGNVLPAGSPLAVGGILTGSGVIKKGECIAIVKLQTGKVSTVSYNTAGTGLPADPKSCGPLFKKCFSATSQKQQICHPGLKGSAG